MLTFSPLGGYHASKVLLPFSIAVRTLDGPLSLAAVACGHNCLVFFVDVGFCGKRAQSPNAMAKWAANPLRVSRPLQPLVGRASLSPA